MATVRDVTIRYEVAPSAALETMREIGTREEELRAVEARLRRLSPPWVTTRVSHDASFRRYDVHLRAWANDGEIVAAHACVSVEDVEAYRGTLLARLSAAHADAMSRLVGSALARATPSPESPPAGTASEPSAPHRGRRALALGGLDQ